MSEKYKFLRELSNEQLGELLRHTLDEEQSDMQYIEFILEVMEEREKSNPVNNLSDVRQAWDDFQKFYNLPENPKTSLYESLPPESVPSLSPQRKRHASIVKKVIFAALIACFSLSVVASAYGYNVFQVIGAWTKDVFSFMYVEAPSSLPSTNNPKDENENYDSLQDALDAKSITEILAPTWLPQDFVQNEVLIISHLMSSEIQAYYTNEELTISISITKFEEKYRVQHEKDENPVEEFEINGVIHYLFTNNGRTTATWNINSIECSINGDISLNEMKKIIKSMY